MTVRVSRLTSEVLTQINLDGTIRIPRVIVEVLTYAKEPFVATEIFPDLVGLAWPVKRKPLFSTLVDPHSSGYEVRTQMWQYPKYEFQLIFDYLPDYHQDPLAVQNTDFQQLMGFFLARGGRFEAFLFKDRYDYQATEWELLETPGGANLEYFFTRRVGDYVEPVGQVDHLATIELYEDGVLIDPGQYTVVLPNRVTFSSARTGTITGTYQYYFQCTFLEDSAQFDQFARNFWELQEVTLKSEVIQ